MRSYLALTVVPVLLLAATGCSADDERATTDPAPAPQSSSTAPPGDAPTDLPTGLPSQSNGAGTDTCEEVVAGINAFNEGDYEETVEHFEDAIPLAEAADDGSPEAEQLLAAVRYYANLAPDDYLDASLTSPDFARWKEVTLGQCVDGSTGGGDGGGLDT